MNTLADILLTVKDLESNPLVKDLSDKKLRLCIDGKQIVEIDTVELIPRRQDLTLFVTSSKNIGYDGSERALKKEDLLAEMKAHPVVPADAFEKVEEEAPRIITQEDLKQQIKKEDDGRESEAEEGNSKEDDHSESKGS